MHKFICKTIMKIGYKFRVGTRFKLYRLIGFALVTKRGSTKIIGYSLFGKQFITELGIK